MRNKKYRFCSFLVVEFFTLFFIHICAELKNSPKPSVSFEWNYYGETTKNHSLMDWVNHPSLPNRHLWVLLTPMHALSQTFILVFTHLPKSAWYSSNCAWDGIWTLLSLSLLLASNQHFYQLVLLKHLNTKRLRTLSYCWCHFTDVGVCCSHATLR
jgi:hypothetical protein